MANAPGILIFNEIEADSSFDATGAHGWQSNKLPFSAFVASTLAAPSILAIPKSSPRQVFFSNSSDQPVTVMVRPAQIKSTGTVLRDWIYLATVEPGSFNVDSPVAGGFNLPAGCAIGIYSDVAPTKGSFHSVLIFR